MTPESGATRLTDVEIRDNPLHRAFSDPGSRKVSKRFVRQLSGNCTTPVHLAYSGMMPVDPDHPGLGKWQGGERFTDYEIAVRCRHCPSCLRAHRFQWGLRAHWECLVAPQTWFFTGTHRDQTRDYVEAKNEVQRFLKRLRKRVTNKEDYLRYLMLPELHKSGAIHWHGLLHSGGSINYRDVRSSWNAGYSYPSLVRNKRASSVYVTKYVTKDLYGADRDESGRSRRPRVMASRAPTYGDPVIIRDAEVLAEMAKQKKEEVTDTWLMNLQCIIREHDRKKERKTIQRQLIELRSPN